ncbi:helix-turn-helix transcriptional regulator [Intestinimonas sp.]|uniref:ArsR/SmtB family transcription factor n=1 Tax=Intestinimonas sp. TaxID=1965293 RepID=UPI002613B511|nr:metalloregulator ArsR/SmtB family transcription factor [Intestinimonas sp.]
MENGKAPYQEKTELLKALSHPLRLQIVRGLLVGGCRNVRCMEEGTGQSQSTISQHLMRLKAAGVVKCQRSGNEMYYEVADPQAAAVVAALFGDEAEDYNCPCAGREEG